MIFFLLGPSGIGKSTAREILATDYSLFTIDLDLISFSCIKYKSKNKTAFEFENRSLTDLFLSLGPDEFFFHGKGMIELINLAAPDLPIVIDVGAGFLRATYASDFLEKYECIFIDADDCISYRRYCNRNESLVLSMDEHIESLVFVRSFCAGLKNLTNVDANSDAIDLTKNLYTLIQKKILELN